MAEMKPSVEWFTTYFGPRIMPTEFAHLDDMELTGFIVKAERARDELERRRRWDCMLTAANSGWNARQALAQESGHG